MDKQLGWIEVRNSRDIANVRKRMGFTQQELADWLGVHRQTIAKWETVKGHNITSLALRSVENLYGLYLARCQIDTLTRKNAQ